MQGVGKKSRFSTNIWLWLVKCDQQLTVNRAVVYAVSVHIRLLHRPPRISEFLFITEEQNLIVCSGKSDAKGTNNKRLCSTYCTIEANYWQTQSIARPLCDSRATCNMNNNIKFTPQNSVTNEHNHKLKLISGYNTDNMSYEVYSKTSSQ